MLPLGPVYMTTRYASFASSNADVIVSFSAMEYTVRFSWTSNARGGSQSDVDGLLGGTLEGDVLVVESNGYTDRSWLDFGGHPHTEALRITNATRAQRRIHRRAMTMTDPTVYASRSR